MAIPEPFLDELLDRTDIVDLVSESVRLTQKGRNYWGLCPFHSEKTPSFSVSADKRIFKCFGCGKGGGAINFVMELDNLSFREAVEVLAKRVGMEVPDSGPSAGMRERREKLLELNKQAARTFHKWLYAPEGAEGLAYLQKRGLSRSTLTNFGLGFAPNSWDALIQALADQGYDKRDLLDAGLAVNNKDGRIYDRFRNRVMFPIIDVRGNVIGFGGRVMDDSTPKYLNSPDTPVYNKSRNVFALNIAKTSKAGRVILTEGYMDTISLHQAGFDCAVASLGTSLTSEHAQLLARYFQEAIISYDGDGAGVAAAQRAIPLLEKAGLKVKVLRMQGAKDPDEFIKNLGTEAFEERINKARNGFLFSLEILEKEYDMNSPEGKTAFHKEAAKRLTMFEEEIERNNYIEAVAEKYRIGYEELKKLVGKMAIQMGQATPAERPKQTANREKQKEDGNLKSQKILLTWLIENEALFAQIKKYIVPEDFTKELYRTVAEILYEQYEAGEVNPAKVMNHFTDEEEHREVAELFHTKIRELTTKEEQEKALKETIIRVKYNSIEFATKMLNPTDIVGLQRLMEAKKSLQDLQKMHISID